MLDVGKELKTADQFNIVENVPYTIGRHCKDLTMPSHGKIGIIVNV